MKEDDVPLRVPARTRARLRDSIAGEMKAHLLLLRFGTLWKTLYTVFLRLFF